MLLNRRKRLMLYIHIPFCAKKCNYCDFRSFYADEKEVDTYVNALINEITKKSVLATNLSISSIYIGGGTPSFINATHIEKILRTILINFKVEDNAEITIEANPNSITKEKLNIYKSIGINRLSIGLQSTFNDELKILGRLHTYEDFLNAYDDALHAGFKNINIDLIYGIPSQTVDRFKESLTRVLKFMPTHISIYNLIVEESTKFYEMEKEGTLHLPSEDEVIKMDDLIDETTKKYNFIKYEVSNFAKNNFFSMHNLGYWSDVYYLGFGLNASSYFYDLRMKNHFDMEKYLRVYEDNKNKNAVSNNYESINNQNINYENKYCVNRNDINKENESKNNKNINYNLKDFDYILNKNELEKYYLFQEKIYDENTDDFTISKSIKEVLLDSNDFKNSFEEVLIPTKEELMSEYVMMGMRKTVGISKKDFFSRFSEIFDNVYYFELKKYLENEMILKDGDYYYLSDKGMYLSNVVLADFML